MSSNILLANRNRLLSILSFPDHIVIELATSLILRNIDRKSAALTEPNSRDDAYDYRRIAEVFIYLDQHNQMVSHHDGWAWQDNTRTTKHIPFASDYCICTNCGNISKGSSPTYNNYSAYCPDCVAPSQAKTWGLSNSVFPNTRVYWPTYLENMSVTTQEKVHKVLVKKLLDRQSNI